MLTVEYQSPLVAMDVCRCNLSWPVVGRRGLTDCYVFAMCDHEKVVFQSVKLNLYFLHLAK